MSAPLSRLRTVSNRCSCFVVEVVIGLLLVVGIV